MAASRERRRRHLGPTRIGQRQRADGELRPAVRPGGGRAARTRRSRRRNGIGSRHGRGPACIQQRTQPGFPGDGDCSIAVDLRLPSGRARVADGRRRSTPSRATRWSSSTARTTCRTMPPIAFAGDISLARRERPSRRSSAGGRKAGAPKPSPTRSAADRARRRCTWSPAQTRCRRR